jgi:hypothetical protein
MYILIIIYFWKSIEKPKKKNGGGRKSIFKNFFNLFLRMQFLFIICIYIFFNLFFYVCNFYLLYIYIFFNLFLHIYIYIFYNVMLFCGYFFFCVTWCKFSNDFNWIKSLNIFYMKTLGSPTTPKLLGSSGFNEFCYFN